MTAQVAPGRTGPGVGDPAPDFAAVDTHGTPVRLGELRGTPVMLVFVPFAFSGTCTGELGALQDAIEDFDDAGARLLVVSCDPTYALRAWQQQGGYPFDLLSDFWPHGRIAESYGVFDDTQGFARRGSFLIDADGVIRWLVVHDRAQPRDVAAYRTALALL